MRILHVFKVYQPDNFTGIPRVIHSIAEGSNGLGVETAVLTLSNNVAPDQPIVVGSHYVYQAKRDLNIRSSGFSWSVFNQFRTLAAQADVIHYHFPWPMADLLHLRQTVKKPSLVTYHSDIVKQKLLLRVYEPLMHQFLKSVDIVVATSPNYFETSSVLQRYREKVSIVPIGIGSRPAIRKEPFTRLRSQLGEGFFLFIGSHRYYKGLTFLIEAARQCSSIKVVLAGDLHASQIPNLPDNVVVLGTVSDDEKEALLELTSALVLPSHLRSEAFGVVLLEAMRAAKPVITCEIGSGMSYVNVANVTGLSVPPCDPKALADAMKILAENPRQSKALGLKGQRRFLENFQEADMAAKYNKLYRSIT